MSPLEMPSWLQERYEPSRDGLLRQLATSMDAALVDFIAAADYGDDFQENQAALWPIIRRIEVPCPLQWIPREVLELTRWSEPGEYQLAQAGTLSHDATLRVSGATDSQFGAGQRRVLRR